MHLGDSDSDSEDDLADMSRRLAERRRAQSISQKNTIVNNEKMLQNSNLWSHDDSEGEMDVRQMIARKVVEKRRRESSEAMSSEKIRTNKVSTKAASQEGEFDCTPKICHKIKAGIKAGIHPYSKQSCPKIRLIIFKWIWADSFQQ